MGNQLKRITLLVPIFLTIIGCNYSEPTAESIVPTNHAGLNNNEITSVTPDISTAVPTKPPTPTPRLATDTPPAPSTNTPTIIPSTTPSPHPTVQLLPEELNALTGLIICNRMGEFFVVEEAGNLVKQSATLMRDEFLFTFNNNSYFVQDTDVWVKNNSSGDMQPLAKTEGIAEQLIYGRLGEWLLVKISPPAGQPMFQSPGPIVLLRLDGSEHKLLADDLIMGEPLLSTDGKFVIISTQDEVLLIDENETQSAPFEQHFYFGAISPNNQYVAHEGPGVGVSEMSTGNLIMEFEYEGALRVGDIFPEPFQWSPDNEWVAVETFNLQAEPPAVPNQLLVFNMVSGEVQTISNAWNPRWSPNGTILLFATNPRNPGIQLLRFSEPAWEIVETGYEGLPVSWINQNNLQVNSQQYLPIDCETQ